MKIHKSQWKSFLMQGTFYLKLLKLLKLLFFKCQEDYSFAVAFSP